MWCNVAIFKKCCIFLMIRLFFFCPLRGHSQFLADWNIFENKYGTLETNLYVTANVFWELMHFGSIYHTIDILAYLLLFRELHFCAFLNDTIEWISYSIDHKQSIFLHELTFCVVTNSMHDWTIVRIVYMHTVFSQCQCLNVFLVYSKSFSFLLELRDFHHYRCLLQRHRFD